MPPRSADRTAKPAARPGFVEPRGSAAIGLDTALARRRGMLARLQTFLRSALTGGAATLVDLGVVAFAAGILRVPAAAANIPALLAGAVVQFVGNRHFAFRARGGDVRRQAALFALSEAVTLLLNGLLYHLVATHFTLGALAAVVARAVTTNLVFVCWSYPVWSRIFQPAPVARESA